MKLFIDTADIDQIREVWSWGIIDGVTTNPTHVAKTGRRPQGRAGVWAGARLGPRSDVESPGLCLVPARLLAGPATL